MTVGNKRIYVMIFLAVFVLIFIIGVTSEVSLPAGLRRALLGAVIFTGLCIAVGHVLMVCVFPRQNKEDVDSVSDGVGNNLDLTISDPPLTDKDGANSIGNILDGSGGDAFSPLAAKQINPHLNNIINNDPKKLAEIVRKMGLDEE